jgi:subtilase family serine protease
MRRLSMIKTIFAALMLAFMTMAIFNFDLGHASATAPQTAMANDKLQQLRLRQMGAVPEIARPDAYLGRLPATQKLLMIISFQNRNQGEMLKLIDDLYNPASPQYHKWLTAAEFGARFGRDKAEYDAAVAWLQGQGFKIESNWSNRLAIAFSGTADIVERAFKIEEGQFADRAGGRTFYANLQRPQLPPQLDAMAISLMGLNNAYQARGASHGKKIIKAAGVKPQGVTGGGTDFLSPRDIGLAYNITPLANQGFQGQGQRVGVLFDSDIPDSDITALRNMYDLPNGPVERIVPPGLENPGVQSGEQDEITIDVSTVISVAPQAELDIILVPDLLYTTLRMAEEFLVNDGSIPIVSESIVSCESAGFDSAEQAVFQQAVMEGVAFFAASGDDGVECTSFNSNGAQTSNAPGVSVPAVYDGVTAVGGTIIEGDFDDNGNLTNVNDEVVWNEPPGVRFDCDGNNIPPNSDLHFDIGSSGGGVSQFVDKPTYQSDATGFEGGVLDGSMRVVPDVSLVAAGPPYPAFIENGELLFYFGTSVASPYWAGMMALVNQFTGAIQGSPNSEIYRMGVEQFGNNGAVVYRDIISGDNSIASLSPCAPDGIAGFAAGFGYDAVTGWGTPDLTAFANNYGGGGGGQPGFSLSLTPSSQTVAPGGSVDYSLGITTTGGFSDAVNISVDGLPDGASFSLQSSSFPVDLNIATSDNTPPGDYTFTVTGTSGSLTSSVSADLVVQSSGLSITDAAYDKPFLMISGAGFGEFGDAEVSVNSFDITDRIRDQNDGMILLKGSRKKLGIFSGTNVVTVTVNGASASFTFDDLAKPNNDKRRLRGPFGICGNKSPKPAGTDSYKIEFRQ